MQPAIHLAESRRNSSSVLELHHSSAATASISEIIKDRLYQGNAVAANDLELLKQRGITHILNVSDEVPCFHREEFTYEQIPVVASKTFVDAMRRIVNFIAEGDVVFVHCNIGRDRSSIAVLAYIIREMQYDYKHALEYLQAKRSEAKPNLVMGMLLKKVVGSL